AEQAELDSQREILSQRQNLELREVEVKRQVELANATRDQEVQSRRALAVEQQQEAEVLVPARAERQAIEIRAEGERKRITIQAEAQAEATRTSALAQAEATEKKGHADAAAFQAMRQAEAEGTKASLLAEAEGRRELAAASSAEDEINLRQFIVEMAIKADVEKAQAIAEALAGLGGNVRIVQIGSNGHNGNGAGESMTGNTFMDMLLNIPEVAEVFKAKVEALSGEDITVMLSRITDMLNNLKGMRTSDHDSAPAKKAQVSVKAEVETEAHGDTSAAKKPPKSPPK
ncbi:MAG TPA: hypothetical protein VJZ27_12175, partial [Aggregatilineales bacterium]|nr:hypothetical protein [Aggregatilineales bacterium]